MEHWIAKYVLKQLLTKSPATWSELRPDGESDNLFGYYMKRLVASGMIENREKQWYLTEKGRVTLSDISLDTMRETKTPKLCVMIAATAGDTVAIYHWKRAPYSGKVTVPYGRWHRGDSFATATQAELLEKAGIELPQEAFIQSQLFSVDEATIHEVHTVCTVSVTEPQNYSTPKGEWLWVDRSSLDEYDWATADHRKVADAVYKGVSA